MAADGTTGSHVVPCGEHDRDESYIPQQDHG